MEQEKNHSSSLSTYVVRKAKSLLNRLHLRQRTPEEIFDDIYEHNVWGGGAGEFCSGDGSVDPAVVQPYVTEVQKLLREWLGRKPSVLDIGCGDLRIARHFFGDVGRYIGVDVAERLIREHRRTDHPAHVSFRFMNAAKEELPGADVCLVRQVLQHLSNREIKLILAKLRVFSAVIITEHVPKNFESTAANLDKATGAGIRLSFGSGVSLSEQPFDIPTSELRTLLEVPDGHAEGVYPCKGILRTTLWTPGYRQRS